MEIYLDKALRTKEICKVERQCQLVKLGRELTITRYEGGECCGSSSSIIVQIGIPGLIVRERERESRGWHGVRESRDCIPSSVLIPLSALPPSTLPSNLTEPSHFKNTGFTSRIPPSLPESWALRHRPPCNLMHWKYTEPDLLTRIFPLLLNPSSSGRVAWEISANHLETSLKKTKKNYYYSL
jgi:hypothetical protein